jgi:hypothetical protein
MNFVYKNFIFVIPMAQKTFSDELEKFRQYLRSESNEDAKTPLS